MYIGLVFLFILSNSIHLYYFLFYRSLLYFILFSISSYIILFCFILFYFISFYLNIVFFLFFYLRFLFCSFYLISFNLFHFIQFNFISSIICLAFVDELWHLQKPEMELLTWVCTTFILLYYFILFLIIYRFHFFHYFFIWFLLFHLILYHPLVVFLHLMNCGMYTNRKWNYEHVSILPFIFVSCSQTHAEVRYIFYCLKWLLYLFNCISIIFFSFSLSY